MQTLVHFPRFRLGWVVYFFSGFSPLSLPTQTKLSPISLSELCVQHGRGVLAKDLKWKAVGEIFLKA